MYSKEVYTAYDILVYFPNGNKFYEIKEHIGSLLRLCMQSCWHRNHIENKYKAIYFCVAVKDIIYLEQLIVN